MKKILVVILALLALALATAQDAQADESTFLRALDRDGLTANTNALTLGHQVCSDIVGNGVAGVDNEARQGLSTGMPTRDVANFIGDAVIELCPAGLPAMQSWANRHRQQSWWAT